MFASDVQLLHGQIEYQSGVCRKGQTLLQGENSGGSANFLQLQVVAFQLLRRRLPSIVSPASHDPEAKKFSRGTAGDVAHHAGFVSVVIDISLDPEPQVANYREPPKGRVDRIHRLREISENGCA
jgi:hypothetical protein